MRRTILPAFTILAMFLVSAASGQDLKNAAAAQKLAADKLISQVNGAIDQSRKQDATEAKFDLRKMVNEVKASQDLTESQRGALVSRLQARLAAVEETARGKKVLDDQRPTPRDPDRPKYTKPAADPSGGVGSVARNFADSAKAASKSNAELIQRREKGILATNLGDKTPPPSGKDFELPANWKELSQARSKMVDQQLTKKEVALLKTLNSTMSVNYDGDKFKAVLNHIMEKSGLTIIVDEASARDINLDYDDPVSFKIEKVSVRTALKKILGDRGLTYIIKEGNIQVMTPKKASEYTVVRTYQIDDLIAPSPQVTMMFGPLAGQLQMQQNAQVLANLIQQTVAPDYWQPNGPGSITFFPPTRSLIIRGSAEMHYQLAAPGLFGGR